MRPVMRNVANLFIAVRREGEGSRVERRTGLAG
jgi:hypothetical protein